MGNIRNLGFGLWEALAIRLSKAGVAQDPFDLVMDIIRTKKTVTITEAERRWHEKEGVIFITLTNDHLGITYEIAIFRGMSFDEADRTIPGALAEAERRGYTRPDVNAMNQILNIREVEMKDMGLTLLVPMIDPKKEGMIRVRVNHLNLKSSDLSNDTFDLQPEGEYWKDRLARTWGLAFVVSEISTKVSD